MTEIDWTSGQPVWAHTNASAGGRLVATYTNDGAGGSNLHFQTADWLGTRRLQTDYAGNPEETCSGGSFGDALNCVPVGHAADATEQHFTGKERDQESGLDYFGARYYSSSMGRFSSPDWAAKPEAVPYSSLADPQTLNLYGYMRNNPLGGVDSDGHLPDWLKHTAQSLESGLSTVWRDLGSLAHTYKISTGTVRVAQ